MCHFDKKDMLNFFMIIFPFGVTAIAGTIRAGYGLYLWLWLVYAIFSSLYGKRVYYVVTVRIGQRKAESCIVMPTMGLLKYGNINLLQ